ncbi:hypothetical protein D3C75_654290 [compost metagenome]
MNSRYSFGLLHVLCYVRGSADKKAGAVQFDFLRKPAFILLYSFKIGYRTAAFLLPFILRGMILQQQCCSFYWHWHGCFGLASFR